MKALYVKNNSTRNKYFQLQTRIYEENGQKFVKKSALIDEALPHLYRMKINHEKLKKSIVNSKVKLVDMLEEDKHNITFEYIEGENLKMPKNTIEAKSFIKKNRDFFENSFQTAIFNSKNVSSEFIKIFGDLDYSVLDGKTCFKGCTNIDLISSNIIARKDEFYIIDYEWVFDFELPIDYILFRDIYSNINTFEFRNQFNEIFITMEENFINNYVGANAFHKYKKQYLHKKYNVSQEMYYKDRELNEQDKLIRKRDMQVNEKDTLLQQKDIQMADLCHQGEEKDIQLQMKDIKIQEKNVLLQEKDMEIHEKNKALFKYSLLKDEYTSIYISKSWKNTRFLRKIKGRIK